MLSARCASQFAESIFQTGSSSIETDDNFKGIQVIIKDNNVVISRNKQNMYNLFEEF